MSAFEEAVEIAKKHASPITAAEIDGIAMRVEVGSADDKVLWANLLEEEYAFMGRSNPGSWAPEDVGRFKQLMLAFYKEIAETGHAGAMRHVACAYANGHDDFSVEHHARGWRMHSTPNLKEAFKWAAAAAYAGDDVSRDVLLPGIKSQLRR